MVNAEVTSSGELSLDGQIAGRIQGFRYTPDANVRAEPAAIDDAAINGAAINDAETTSAIARELEARANRLSEAVDGALVLANDGAIRWLGEPIAKIVGGESLLNPRAVILADETLASEGQQKAQTRVDLWLTVYIKRLLGPLFDLETAVGLEGAARNVAQRLVENLGVLERGRVAQDVKTLDQNARGALRKLGVRFGAYYIYIPALVKPAIRVLATQLWALRQGGAADGTSLHEIPQLAASGRTSFLADNTIPKETYRVAGFRLCGERAVRVDIVERLADLIRPAVAYRSGVSAGAPPPGAADGDGFVVTGAMTSLTGCSGEQFASVLRSLGFVSQLVKGPALTVVEKPAAPVEATASHDVAAEATETSGISADEADAVARDPHAPAAEDYVTHEAADCEPSASISVAAPVAPREEPASELVESVTEPKRVEEAEPVAEAEPLAASEAIAEPEPVTEAEAPIAAEEPTATAEPVAEVGPAAVAEPVAETLVEVWRPRPPVRQQRSPRGGARDKTSPAGAQADGQSAERGGAVEEPGRRRRRPPPRPAQRSEPGGEPPPKPEQDKPWAARGNRRRPERASHERSGSEQAPRGPRGGPNSGGAGDDPGRRERKQQEGPPPARREAPVNLDSPFAKLLALKAQLETKGKGG